jgi:hypothetical protein
MEDSQALTRARTSVELPHARDLPPHVRKEVVKTSNAYLLELGQTTPLDTLRQSQVAEMPTRKHALEMFADQVLATPTMSIPEPTLLLLSRMFPKDAHTRAIHLFALLAMLVK